MSSNSSTHVQQLQNDLKIVLKSCDGKVELADLPSRWKATHGTRLNLAAYGVSNVSSLLDRCRTICRLERINGVEVVSLVYNQSAVSNFVATIQQELHRSSRQVSSGLVINQVCQQLGVLEYKELGLGNPHQLPILRRLSELESRLVTYITSYTTTRMLASIYDMEQTICSFEGVDTFDALTIGPITEHPLVRTVFKLPPDQQEVLQVTTIEVMEALNSLLHRSRGPDRKNIAPGEIAQLVAEKRGADPMALGIRITGIGFYIKMASDMRRKEREANDALQQQVSALKAKAKQNAQAQKAEIKDKYAQDVAALEHKEAEKLQELQQLLAQRVLEAKKLADTGGSANNISLMAMAASNQQQLHPAFRRTGTIAAPTQAYPSLSWTSIATFVRQLDEQDSLASFSEAVARHVYSSSGMQTKSGQQDIMQQTAGSMHHIKFWQADLLAGLLMQTMMLIGKALAGEKLLQCMISIGSKIATDAGDFSASLFVVPAASAASVASTRWLALFWNMLQVAKEASGQDSSAALLSLAFRLSDAFAYNGAEASKKVKKRILLFWQTDCLAQVLLQALQSYVSTGHAELDALTIEEFLVQQTALQGSQPSPQPTDQAHGNPQTGLQADAPIPVDAASLAAAFAELQDGTSVSSLARLEQHLLHHFQVAHFAQLGHGASILQWLANSREADGMADLRNGHTLTSFHEVMQVLQQALQQGSGSSENALKRALCNHFSVAAVEQLGHGGIAILRKLQEGYDLDASVVIASLTALTCTTSTPSRHSSPVKTATAMDMLQAAPYLTDLEQWLQWTLAVEPTLGPLHIFLQQHGDGANFTVLALPGRCFVKVDAKATPSKFLIAASAGHCNAAMAAVLGMMVSAGGLASTPIALIASHSQAALETLCASKTADAACDTDKAATFVLDCLMQLPKHIRSVLGKQLLLHPFATVAGSEARAEAAVLHACKDNAAAQMLYGLGIQLGVSIWQDHWLQLAAAESCQAVAPDHQSMLAQASSPGLATTQQPAVPDAAFLNFNQLLPISAASSPDGKQSEVDEMTTPGNAVVGFLTQRMSRHQLSEPKSPDAHSQACQQVISDICEAEFGIGVELDTVGTGLRQKQNDRLGRALQRLSQDLYSKDVHFVLELVQNADDNVYDEGVCPALEFILSADGITILNNEVGFSEQNVRALCDVGNSTKQHKVGYIGQKGIGFKSVFKVTDVAEIHSSGFHISFDLIQHQSLGYILPTWVPVRPHAQPRVPSLESAATQVYLPYKQAQTVPQLLHNFDDIQPTLLLFLQKLQCITITDRTTEGKDAVMLRRQLPNGVVELRYGSVAQHSQKWLVVNRTVQPGVKRLDVEVEQTDLALAFELNSEQLSQQPVFAFLPLRRYGLRFIIQANFIVPASREAVESNSAWNQELRGHLPQLFLQALEAFQAQPSTEHLEWVNRWLQCIPLPGEAEDFFAPLPQAVITCLRTAPCIATETGTWILPAEAVISHAGTDAARGLLAHAISLGIPSVNYVHPALTALHCTSALRLHLGIKLLDTDHLLGLLKTAAQQGMLPKLGPHWCSRMLACIFDMLATKEPHIRSLRAQDIKFSPAAQSLIQELTAVPMFPVTPGTWVAAGTAPESNLFMPVMPACTPTGTTTAEQDLPSQQQKQSLQLALRKCNLQLENFGLHVLTQEFTDISNDDKPNLQKMLQILGVRELTHLDVIERYVMPAFKADSACDSPADQLVAMLAFIGHSQLLQRTVADGPVSTPEGIRLLEQLQRHAVICTEQGPMRFADAPALHMPMSLGCKIDLQHMVPEHSFTMISSRYSEQKMLPADQMRKLLLQLGAADHIAVPQRTCLLQPSEKAASPWADINLGDAPETGWTISDYSGAEFDAVVHSITQEAEHQAQMLTSLKNVASIVSSRWEVLYSRFLTATCTQQSGRSITLHSSFAWALRTLPWLPSSKGIALKGCDLFQKNSREVMQLLHDHVPCMEAAIKSTSMCTFLGIQNSVTVPMLLTFLQSWSQSHGFATSIQHMTHVYEYLHWQMLADPVAAAEVCAAFTTSKLIWLPAKQNSINAQQADSSVSPDADSGPEPPRRSQILQGRFYGAADSLFMKDHTHIIEETEATCMRGLVKFYSADLHAFFLEQLVQSSGYPHAVTAIGSTPSSMTPPQFLGPDWAAHAVLPGHKPLVGVYPSTADYVQLLADLAAQPEPSDHIFGQAIAVLLHWSRLIGSAHMPRQDVEYMQQSLYRLAILPTLKGRWVSLADGVVVQDDEALGKAFDAQPVHFLWLSKDPDPQSSRAGVAKALQPLLEAVGISYLSLCAQPEVLPTFSHFNTEVTNMISQAFPYIQRFFFCHRAGDYNHVAGRVLPMLNGFRCSETRELYVVYSLALQLGKPAITTSVKCNAALEFKDGGKSSMLHVVEGDAGNLHDAFIELGKFFGLNSADTDLCDFLQALNVTQLAGQSVEAFMDRRGFRALPEYEQVWAVPVSEVPAAYNLRAHLADLTEQEDEDSISQSTADRHASRTPANRPFRAKQKVEVWPPAAPLVPRGVPSSSQAVTAQSASDSPRNTYLHDGLQLPAKQASNAPLSDGTASQPNSAQPGEAAAPSTGRQQSNEASSSFSFPNKVTDGEDDVAGRDDGGVHSDPQRSKRAPDQQASLESEHSQLDGHRGSASHTASISKSGQEISWDRLRQLDDHLEGGAAHLHSQVHGSSAVAARPGSANHKADKHSSILEPTDFAGNSIGVPFSLSAVPALEAADGIEELSVSEAVLRQMTHSLPELAASTQSKEADLEVGRWGEELVYRFLLAHASTDISQKGLQQTPAESAWQIEWVNQDFNTSLLFDLRLRGQDGAEQFIEVKSSISMSKAFFEMSHQEVSAARRLGDKYSLYRVCGAGSVRPSLLRIVNPVQKWADGQIKVCVVL